MFEIAGVRIPEDRALMSPAILDALKRGKYERAEARALPAMIAPDDRVVDLGGGVGFLAVLAARLAAHVVCVEANPDLAPFIARLAELNGVNLEVRTLLAASEAGDGRAPFHIHRDLWASSPDPADAAKALRTVEVETATPRALVEAHSASLLIVDAHVMRAFQQLDDAAFARLWRETASAPSLRKLVFEFHDRHTGQGDVRRLFDAMSACGFVYAPRVSAGSVVLFSRFEA